MSNARFSILQAGAVSDNRVTNAQFRTLAALGMFGDKEGWCFPKLKTLSDILGKSKQAISMDIKALVEYGYVEVTHQYRKDGSQQNNLYRLLFDIPPLTPPEPPLSPEVDGGLTAELDGGLSSEVDALTPHSNAPINAINNKGVQYKNWVDAYQNEITAGVTPLIADSVKTVIDEWNENKKLNKSAIRDCEVEGERAVIEAIKKASKNNVRSWAYVEKIMKNWIMNGYGWHPAMKDNASVMAVEKQSDKQDNMSFDN